jgi:hypothetical protein
MARRYATDIDLLGFSLLNAMVNPVSSDPSGLGVGQAGRIWFNSTTGKFMYWNGTAAIDLSARANHTGTQLASTISDLAATVQAYRLDQFAAPTGPLSVGSQRIINQADPTGAQDSATKNYVDTQLAGLTTGQVIKGSVRVAATSNVSLAAPGATIDGVALAANDVVLLTGQTTASQNGPYVWTAAGSALTRAANWDTSAEAVLGSYWVVREGSNADTFALLTNDTAVTLGTTSLTFAFRGTAGATYSVNGGLTLSGTVLSVNPGTGILAPAGSSTTTSIDTTVVARKVAGIIPATTSGVFSVSGATVTINHALANFGAALTLRAYTSPVSGYSAGQLVEVDNVASDANNLVVTLPGAPAANNWFVQVIG